MGTDKDWEKWGSQDPYFGVLSDSKFRAANLDLAAREEFFLSGEKDTWQVLQTIRTEFDPLFKPDSALDFGSGVGRLTISLARLANRVVGADISPSMIAEATKNCEEAGLDNVRFVLSDDRLSLVPGKFSLVYSFIVMQHIPWRRGRTILKSLADRVETGGYLVVQVITARKGTTIPRALVRIRYSFPPFNWLRNAIRRRPLFEPPMQMNPYHLPTILADLSERGFVTAPCKEEVVTKNYNWVFIFAHKRGAVGT
jgi:SAM-dependent methyltransferase